MRFQNRAYESNPIKARAQKRFVVGFKETQRQLAINKIKLLIIATDLEKCDEPGGINALIESIKAKCSADNSVRYFFSLKRRKLGYILLKKVPVSCVGIISLDGTEHVMEKLKELIEIEKLNYSKGVLVQ